MLDRDTKDYSVCPSNTLVSHKFKVSPHSMSIGILLVFDARE